MRTIGLLGGDALDMDNKLLTVDIDDLARHVLEVTTNNEDLIVLAERDRANLQTIVKTPYQFQSQSQ